MRGEDQLCINLSAFDKLIPFPNTLSQKLNSITGLEGVLSCSFEFKEDNIVFSANSSQATVLNVLKKQNSLNSNLPRLLPHSTVNV
jgi:hypothetical protein